MNINAKADLGKDVILQSEKELSEDLLSLFNYFLFMVSNNFVFKLFFCVLY